MANTKTTTTTKATSQTTYRFDNPPKTLMQAKRDGDTQLEVPAQVTITVRIDYRFMITLTGDWDALCDRLRIFRDEWCTDATVVSRVIHTTKMLDIAYAAPVGL